MFAGMKEAEEDGRIGGGGGSRKEWLSDWLVAGKAVDREVG